MDTKNCGPHADLAGRPTARTLQQLIDRGVLPLPRTEMYNNIQITAEDIDVMEFLTVKVPIKVDEMASGNTEFKRDILFKREIETELRHFRNNPLTSSSGKCVGAGYLTALRVLVRAIDGPPVVGGETLKKTRFSILEPSKFNLQEEFINSVLAMPDFPIQCPLKSKESTNSPAPPAVSVPTTTLDAILTTLDR